VLPGWKTCIQEFRCPVKPRFLQTEMYLLKFCYELTPHHTLIFVEGTHLHLMNP
jgi:hypothetical protein